MNNKLAMKAAFRDVPETCPIIDKTAKSAINTIESGIISEHGDISSSLSHEIEYTINGLIDIVKEQISHLRDALINAHLAKLDLEKAFDDVNTDLFDANKTIINMEEEIKDREFWEKQERYY